MFIEVLSSCTYLGMSLVEYALVGGFKQLVEALVRIFGTYNKKIVSCL
jgi:hypothetical protein